MGTSMLLLKYKAHINVEWCNQSTSIKYLFKYISKRYDRISAAIVMLLDDIDIQCIYEVNQYLDCIYILPCETSQRIFSFPLHERTPTVERSYFHLLGEHSIIFNNDEDMYSLLSKPSVKESMFTSWLKANKIYNKGKNLTHAQFVTKFVYIAKK